MRAGFSPRLAPLAQQLMLRMLLPVGGWAEDRRLVGIDYSWVWVASGASLLAAFGCVDALSNDSTPR